MHALLSVLVLTGAGNIAYCRPDVFHASAPRRCRMYRVRAPKVLLSLAVATNQKDRERGLMEVRVLPRDVGMIFSFVGGDDMRLFWMKDTVIPLDMVFVRADGTVSSVARNVPATTQDTPNARVARRYGAGQFVIELNAGEAERAGLTPGVRLTLPELGAQ